MYAGSQTLPLRICVRVVRIFVPIVQQRDARIGLLCHALMPWSYKYLSTQRVQSGIQEGAPPPFLTSSGIASTGHPRPLHRLPPESLIAPYQDFGENREEKSGSNARTRHEEMQTTSLLRHRWQGQRATPLRVEPKRSEEGAVACERRRPCIVTSKSRPSIP